MATNSKDPKIPSAGLFNQRLSWNQKKAYDFKWAEDMADYFDTFNGAYTDLEKYKRLGLNYDLYNGRGESAMRSFKGSTGNNHLQEEGFDLGFEDVQHHDIMSQVAKGMVGEQRKRPLKPIAVDGSGAALNQRKRKELELRQDYLTQTIIAPMQQQILMQYMQENGITDVHSLSPEQQQQMNADVSQRTEAKTPKEIKKYMRSEYKTSSETQAQKLMDYLMVNYNIKWKTDENFKHAVITGAEVYKTGVIHGDIEFELVNYNGFTYSASPNSHFIEDGDWAKYEQVKKISDIYNQFGDQFTPAHLKKLDSLFSALGNGGDNDTYGVQSNLVSIISSDPGNELFNGDLDVRTKQGQAKLRDIYQQYGSINQNHSQLRHVHITWKSLRKLKNIHRKMPNDKIERFWVDESYTFNPMKGDVKEEIAYVPEVWETDKIGYADAIYLNKRPIPYQYRSTNNPWNVKLPYIGVEYNRLMGNTKNVSPMDLGKPWQYKFNVQMARLHEMEATDVGKILLTSTNAKPKDWTWGKWFDMIKYGKIAPVDFQAEGMNPMEAQAIRGIDLSNIQDMTARVNYLEWLRNQVALAMSYNPSRLGEVSPYTSVSNNQQNIIQSVNQTEDIYSTHNMVVENLLNALLGCARIAFKDNPVKKSYMMDDMSMAELDLDWEMLQRSEIGIRVRNSSDDFNNIEAVKGQAQAMVQNGMISFPELIRLTWAKNYGDVLNIAEEAEEKMAKQRQEAQAQQEKMMQEQQKMQEALAQQQIDLKLLMQERDIVGNKEVAMISREQMALQYDIDKNGQNDGLQSTIMELQLKDKLESEKNDMTKEKNKEDVRLKDKELDIKKQLGNKKPAKG